MNKHNLPVAPQASPQAGFSFDLSQKALSQWAPELRAESKESDNTITIFDVIGEDYWSGEGVTAKRIAAALRSIGADQDVTVLLNSPGGSIFEGFAIYNLLKDHKGKVTIKVIGLAASAASVIAMAGDELLMGDATFLMIHNCWGLVVGNRHDFNDAAKQMEPFDMAMADIYEARSGISRDELIKMMDDETFITAKDSIEKGFADGYMHEGVVQASIANNEIMAIRQIEALMAKGGATRSQRRDLIQKFKSSVRDATGGSKQDATVTDTPEAIKTVNVAAGAVTQLSKTLLENITCQK